MTPITMTLDQDSVGTLPEVPAVYAIFSEDPDAAGEFRCRYVGSADSLKSAVDKHFSIYEPHVFLRYFMLSFKRKMLSYMPLADFPEGNANALVSEWIQSLNPREHADLPVGVN